MALNLTPNRDGASGTLAAAQSGARPGGASLDDRLNRHRADINSSLARQDRTDADVGDLQDSHEALFDDHEGTKARVAALEAVKAPADAGG
jgi:hypothetical protein